MLIVFEGIDGAGLTTQSKLLAKYLKSLGYDVLLTKEPTKNVIGKFIRKILNKKISVENLTLQILFTADRAEHVLKEILPNIKKKIIICDRYFLSTIAYGALNVDIEYLKKINSIFPIPDIIFILDLDPKISLKRIKNLRSKIEIFEELNLKKVRKNFLKISKELKNCYVIDASRSIEEVFNDIKKIVLKKLKPP